MQLRVRTERQTSEMKARCAVRSGVEGTVNVFARGHGMRRCRNRGQGKAHIQYVLTAIAVNIERLSGLPPAGVVGPVPPLRRCNREREREPQTQLLLGEVPRSPL
ncbi:transposase [Streptomyces sp. NRRL S-1521]|uniref:transposase n=1 Tax=Streptomyces sp. NRRL S-1521 TaxID=1609100 RepID=UPI002279263C|nr:transposase [Streptomyces sp. NRRL S-1521]